MSLRVRGSRPGNDCALEAAAANRSSAAPASTAGVDMADTDVSVVGKATAERRALPCPASGELKG